MTYPEKGLDYFPSGISRRKRVLRLAGRKAEEALYKALSGAVIAAVNIDMATEGVKARGLLTSLDGLGKSVGRKIRESLPPVEPVTGKGR